MIAEPVYEPTNLTGGAELCRDHPNRWSYPREHDNETSSHNDSRTCVRLPYKADGKARVVQARYYKEGNGEAILMNRLYSDKTVQEEIDFICEPVHDSTWGGRQVSKTLKAQYSKNGIANFVTNGGFDATAVAEKVGELNERGT